MQIVISVDVAAPTEVCGCGLSDDTNPPAPASGCGKSVDTFPPAPCRVALRAVPFDDVVAQLLSSIALRDDIYVKLEAGSGLGSSLIWQFYSNLAFLKLLACGPPPSPSYKLSSISLGALGPG